MSRKVYRFSPGVCVCILEHSYRESQRVNVVRASRAEALLEPVPGLNTGDCLSVSVKFSDARKIPLLARVRAVSEKGVILRWLYNQPDEESQLETTLSEHASGANEPAATAQSRAERRAAHGDAILSRALTVESKELAARHQQLHVLNMATISDLIDEAVTEAVEGLTRSVPEEERKRLLEEVEESFQEKLQSFRAEKADLESRAWKLQHQLEQAQRVLEEERNRVIDAESFTVSQDGIAILETQFNRLLNAAVTRGGVDGKVEADMKDIFDRLLDSERKKIGAQLQQAQNDSINLLERKIHRLARTLEEAEKERDAAQRHAAALEASGGGGFHHIVTSGLSEDDPAKDRKLELLKEIFEQNQEMREVLSAAGKLPSGRRRRSAPAPQPAAGEPASNAAQTVAAGEPAGEATEPPRTDSPLAEIAELAGIASAAGAGSGELETSPEEQTSGNDGAPAPFELPDDARPATSRDDTEEITEEITAEIAGDAEEDVEEESPGASIDPDDLPWEPPEVPEEDSGEYTEAGIKRIKPKRVKPPPLQRTS